MAGADWTALNADGRHALAAQGHNYIIGIFGEPRRVAYDLYPRQRGIGDAFMRYGTGKHTALAAETQTAVVDKISCRRLDFPLRGLRGLGGRSASGNGRQRACGENRPAPQEIAPQNGFAFIFSSYGFGH